mmetsp:Transcript_3403/g.4191  ORF Transcript_3403/g.4191 Transcript_3403/m.4191 type:complete len:101 (-) Transcript_3403:341-643(-)
MYDKDFWLAENQCIVTAKKEYEKHKEICQEIIEIWDKAQALEEQRISSSKKLYEYYFSRTKLNTDHTKKLLEVFGKAKEDDIAAKIFSHKNMIDETDTKA